jgi:acetyltransferase
VNIVQIDSCCDPRTVSQLVELFEDAVEGGASVGFLAPLARNLATRYWQERLREVGEGNRIVLVALAAGQVLGTVQLALAHQQNGAHRAEVQRLIVRRTAQRQGLGRALMQEVEAVARLRGRSLLIMNTRTGDSPERLYLQLGWIHVGTIPNFAQNPDGSFNTTSMMYRWLGPPIS